MMRPMQRFHGARVGQLAQRVYVCQSCGCWQYDHRGQPIRIRADLSFYCSNGDKCNGTIFICFDSQTEAKAYASLALRQARGEIADLELQPAFDLHVTSPDGKCIKIGRHELDFRYRDIASGEIVLIDAKGGGDTHMSAWKRKHAEAEYGIEIRIMHG